MFLLLLLAIAPAVALFLFFYFRDKYRKEPFGPLAITFLLGAVVLLPSAAVSGLAQRLTGWRPEVPSLLDKFLGALLIVGVIEESWKFFVVRYYAYARREFDEPYDGIMYSISAALGFATLENIIYVVSHGASVGVPRAFLAVPAHAFDGVLMGYFLGEAKFARTRGGSFLLNVAALGLAILAHGIYDFIVFAVDQRPLMLLNLITFAVLAWVIFFEATRRQADKSPGRDPALVQASREFIEPGSASRVDPTDKTDQSDASGRSDPN